jgi:hypothetical protein
VWHSARGVTGVKIKVSDRRPHKMRKPHVKNPLDGHQGSMRER